jgi:hypothetical protein
LRPPTDRLHPDAALLALGRRFDEAHLKWEAMRPAYLAARDAIGANVEASRARLRQITREGGDDAFLEAYRQVCAEADPEDVTGCGSHFLEQQLDPLEEAILRAPAPATIAGLAVKARALTLATDTAIWEATDPREELEYDEEFLRVVVESVLGLAGVDRFGDLSPGRRPMSDLLARRGFLRQLAGLPLIGGGVTLLGNPTRAAEPVTLDLLRSYSAWLHFERRFLSWELCGSDKSRFDVEDAVVWAGNPGFHYHKAGGEPPPSTRAAVVLSAVGCGWKEGV